jgi:hypothetical protein
MTAVRMACRLLGLSVTALAAVGCTTSGRAAISRAGERGPRNCNPHTLQSGYGFSREDLKISLAFLQAQVKRRRA